MSMRMRTYKISVYKQANTQSGTHIKKSFFLFLKKRLFVECDKKWSLFNGETETKYKHSYLYHRNVEDQGNHQQLVCKCWLQTDDILNTI